MSDGTDQKVYCRPLHAFGTADITKFSGLDEVSAPQFQILEGPESLAEPFELRRIREA